MPRYSAECGIVKFYNLITSLHVVNKLLKGDFHSVCLIGKRAKKVPLFISLTDTTAAEELIG